MNLTDFYIDVSAEISSTGTKTNGLYLNLVTNSSTARDLSDQSITSYGVYHGQWAGISVGVSPAMDAIKCFTAIYSNGSYETAASKGPYANLRTSFRLGVSVTNGSNLSVSFIC